MKVNILVRCSDLYFYENDTSHSSLFPITIIHIVKGKKEKRLVNTLDQTRIEELGAHHTLSDRNMDCSPKTFLTCSHVQPIILWNLLFCVILYCSIK